MTTSTLNFLINGAGLRAPVKVLPLISHLFFLKENNLSQVHPRGVHRPQEIGAALTQLLL
jgi:hypothetical protein